MQAPHFYVFARTFHLPRAPGKGELAGVSRDAAIRGKLAKVKGTGTKKRQGGRIERSVKRGGRGGRGGKTADAKG